MERITRYVFVFIASTVVRFFIAALNGTIVWWLWPYAIPAIMPKMVQLDYIPHDLGWVASFAVCWLSSIMFSKIIYNDKEG